MRDDHTPLRNVGRDVRQAMRDIFVGQSVEAVTPHTFLVEAFRQRVIVRQRAVATVKRRVETCDLRQLGTAVKKRPDRSKVVRLMQWRQRDIAFELRRDLPGHAHGPVEVGTSVNNPMSDGEEIDLLRAAQPIPRDLDGGRQIRDFVGTIRLVDQGLFVRTLGLQAWTAADPIDLAFAQAVKLATRAVGCEYLEFQARRSSIDDEDGIHGGHTAVTVARRRRASA